MFIILGIYFTHNFTGVYFSLLSGFPLTSPSSHWFGSNFDARRHLIYMIDTPFREYGIEDFHLCVPTTDTLYVYS